MSKLYRIRIESEVTIFSTTVRAENRMEAMIQALQEFWVYNDDPYSLETLQKVEVIGERE